MHHRSADWLACIVLMPCIALAQQGATRQGATQAPKAAPAASATQVAHDRDAEPAVDTSHAVMDPSAAGQAPGAASQAGSAAEPSRATEPAPAPSPDDRSDRGATAAATPAASPADAKSRAAADAGRAADARHPSGKAMDHLQLGTTDITGNRELPKVMYIVPWKSSNLGDLTGKPLNSLVDEALQPVDRDVFRRENRYYRAVTQGAAHDADRSPAGGGGSAVRDER